MSRGVLLWLALALTVVAALAGPAPSFALTREQANAVALRVLKPAAHKGPVIVFGLTAPLAAKDWVTILDPPPTSASSQTFSRAIRPLGHRAWLFWEDLAPGAFFEHPSRLLLVNDATGRVERNVSLRWVPLIDGFKPPFLGSLATYYGKRYRVFARLRPAPKSKALRLPARASVPAVSPGVFKNDCLILAGDFPEPLVRANFPTLAGFAHDYGLPVYWATSSGSAPSEEPLPPGERRADGDGLAKNVQYLVTHTNCKDVFVYIAGHGDGRGAAGVTTEITRQDVEGHANFTRSRITASDLAQIAEDNPQAQFKFVIDSCYAGRFLFLLRGIANIRVVETSSAATEESLGFMKLPGELDTNPAMMSQFTNAFVHGLREFMQSADEEKAEASGRDVLAAAVANAHRLGNLDDEAQQAGLTHPQGWVNGSPEPKPFPFTLVEASHTHPPGANVSLICVKVRTEPGISIHVSASGAGLVEPPQGVTVTADANGEAIVSLFINRPGEYVFSGFGTRLSDGAVEQGLSLGYTVPPPPPAGAAQGPFDCPIPQRP